MSGISSINSSSITNINVASSTPAVPNQEKKNEEQLAGKLGGALGMLAGGGPLSPLGQALSGIGSAAGQLIENKI